MGVKLQQLSVWYVFLLIKSLPGLKLMRVDDWVEDEMDGKCDWLNDGRQFDETMRALDQRRLDVLLALYTLVGNYGCKWRQHLLVLELEE